MELDPGVLTEQVKNGQEKAPHSKAHKVHQKVLGREVLHEPHCRIEYQTRSESQKKASERYEQKHLQVQSGEEQNSAYDLQNDSKFDSPLLGKLDEKNSV